MAPPLSPAQDGPVFIEAKSAGSAYPKLIGSRDIRLIRILRREDPNGRMRCEVKIASLDEMIYPYIAFSYTWGDPKPSDKLWYNNDNYFELTESLFLILGWLTSFPQLGDVYVWIDALCINQNDNFEKSVQVPLMGEIYFGAQSVFAWVIGGLNAEEHMALMFVQDISTELQKLRERGAEITFEAVEKIPAFKYPSKGWTALAKFLFLPYFQRMWIIQEIVMAREVSVVCGGMMVE
jgi:hypothetical protein